MGDSPLLHRVRAGISATGPLAAVALRLLTRRRANLRRRLVIAAAAALTLILMAVVAVVEAPMMIANIAVATLFGDSDSPGFAADVPADDQCVAVPTPAVAPPAAAPTSDTLGTDSDEPSPADDAPPAATATELIGQIPIGADVDVATTWLLYRLAHSAEPAVSDYRDFAQAYATTRQSLSAHATAVDVAATMDPGADYSPYLLLAQAAVYRLLKQGSVTATDQQATALINGLAATCAGPGRWPLASRS
ncbi:MULTISPECIES: hypothetical protein [Mycolicibacter]|uniref:Uncharacterized protein n=2 Tax=Mycolicibacter TaxID=1073531 RepID=A0ABU5XKZ0_9MYCO|nr:MULTISPECIES: hypothetical protein [unclassified Mycolicibacter]MEB3022955.1 hypothetical protein [Mycolicibacter sp. MYC098]MEB3033465.1 hypothetical protein [Mycolicibacter sp. MYC340]